MSRWLSIHFKIRQWCLCRPTGSVAHNVLVYPTADCSDQLWPTPLISTNPKHCSQNSLSSKWMLMPFSISLLFLQKSSCAFQFSHFLTSTDWFYIKFTCCLSEKRIQLGHKCTDKLLTLCFFFNTARFALGLISFWYKNWPLSRLHL